MTETDWRDLHAGEKARADRLAVENKALRDALRDLRERINWALEHR
jgi:hypothetical protein